MEESYRVLHITEKLQAAGIESFIMNIYRNIDRSKVQFDFLVTRNQTEFYDDEIKELGGKKNVIDKMHIKNTFFRVIRESIELYKFLKKNNYECIHIHSGTPLRVFYLMAAKLAKIKIRIYHSHSGEVLGPHKNLNIKKVIFKFLSNMMPFFATDYFACSEVAAVWMYPKRILKDVKIIHNGIDIEKFLFNNEIRDEYRLKLDLQDNLVIGHIGRFNNQKNHTFLIDVFNELHKENKEAKLLLIGEGKLKEEMKEKVKKLNLEEGVLFLGVRDDVSQIMQAMDVFVLPSNYEGLPVVGVEVQASGLNSIFSDKITKEVIVTNNVKMLSIENNIEEWVKTIESIKTYERKDESENIRKNGYDIKDVAIQVQTFYIEQFKNGEKRL